MATTDGTATDCHDSQKVARFSDASMIQLIKIHSESIMSNTTDSEQFGDRNVTRC